MSKNAFYDRYEQILNVMTYQDFCLGSIIEHLRSLCLTYPELHMDEEVRTLEEDYQRVVDYWMSGYSDPCLPDQLKRIFLQAKYITKRAYTLYRRQHQPHLLHMIGRCPDSLQQADVVSLRLRLEKYVSDLALLQLSPSPRKYQERERIIEEHQKFREALFCRLASTLLWTSEQADLWASVCISPTVDSVDQQLIVSAMMVAGIEEPNDSLVSAMAAICEKSEDPYVRIRALVGLVLMVDVSDLPLKTNEDIRHLLTRPDILQLIGQMQRLLVFSLTVSEEKQVLDDEILPSLLRYQKMSGFMKPDRSEDDQSRFDDPDLEEALMGDVEQVYRRLADLDKEGADINYVMFTKAKYSPFFQSLSNYFMPFDTDHPYFKRYENWKQMMPMITTLLQSRRFCAPDMYTFLDMFLNSFNLIPQEMRSRLDEMLEYQMSGKVTERKETSSDILRNYLQQCFRFYNHNSYASSFCNPYKVLEKYPSFKLAVLRLMGTSGYSEICDQYESYVLDAALLLCKRKYYEMGINMLDHGSHAVRTYEEESGDEVEKSFYESHLKNFSWEYLMGYMFMKQAEGKSRETKDGLLLEAREYATNALLVKPDSIKVLSLLARIERKSCCLKEAAAHYKTLMELCPDESKYELAYVHCMVGANELKGMEQLVYKMDYLYPDREEIKLDMAWILASAGKFDEAVAIYARYLPAGDHPLPWASCNKWFRMAFAYWCNGDRKTAYDLMSRCVLSGKEERAVTELSGMLNRMVHNDYGDFLKRYLQESDINLMMTLLFEVMN